MQFKNYSTISGRIDRNHESQLRKLLKNLRDHYIAEYLAFINCTEKKKLHILQYIYYIYPNAWKLLEFPALGDNLHICNLKMSTKLFKSIFPISA